MSIEHVLKAAKTIGLKTADGHVRPTGQISSEETAYLYQLASGMDAMSWAVELGTFCGRSGFVIASAANELGNPVLCIDWWKYAEMHGTTPDKVTEAWYRLKLEPMPYLWTGDSRKAPRWLLFHEWQVGFLFIDTDHKRKHLYQELEEWLPLVKPGGIIAFHDYDDPDKKFPEMKAAIDEAAVRHLWKLIGRVGSLIAFKKP
jgi:predicted O-methyltransferase YrrM